MKVFTSKTRDGVQIRARAESKKAIGDLVRVVKPGETFLGRPYEWWAALKDGEHEVP